MKKFPAFIFGMMLLVAGKTQDYKKIHEEAIVCDTHNDIISVTIEKDTSSIQTSPEKPIVIWTGCYRVAWTYRCLPFFGRAPG